MTNFNRSGTKVRQQLRRLLLPHTLTLRGLYEQFSISLASIPKCSSRGERRGWLFGLGRYEMRREG